MENEDRAQSEIDDIERAFKQSKGFASENQVSRVYVLPKTIVIGEPVLRVEQTYTCSNDNVVAKLIFGGLCILYQKVKYNSNAYSESKLETVANMFKTLADFLNSHNK